MSGRDVAGNSMASEAEYQRQMIRAAEQLMRFERLADRMFGEGFTLDGLSIKFKGDERADYMLVLRAHSDEGRFVCFRNADGLLEVLRVTFAGLENGSLVWKDDKYGNG